MTEQAVITGTFADLKLVKTRSVVQMVVEVPIEQAKLITDAFGFPLPGSETHVAVARLNERRIEPQDTKQSLAQQAGIMCGDPRFLSFIAENYPHIGNPKDDFEGAAAVRSICGVESRSEFDTDPAAARRWKSLKGKYDGWLTL